MTQGDDHPFEVCAHCGEPFRLGMTYPVTSIREDGETVIYSFCDEACQRAWESTSDEPTTSDPSAESASE